MVIGGEAAPLVEAIALPLLAVLALRRTGLWSVGGIATLTLWTCAAMLAGVAARNAAVP
jgi:1,6-anhydro-N-acetylmuramate kinase